MKKTIISVTCIIVIVSFMMIGLSQRRKDRREMRGKRFLEMMDMNKDGKVSAEEWNTFHSNRFKEIDKNNDGFIDLDEMGKHRKEMMDKRRRKGGRRGGEDMDEM